MLNYKNDELLLGRETANDLIRYKKEHLLFLDEDKKTLNLFSAFVKKEDFVKRDKINQPLQKTAYVKVNDNLARILRQRCSDKKELNKRLELYMQRRSNISDAIKRWFEKSIFPLVLLRITSINEKEFSEWMPGIEYFTDFLNKSRFYAPRKLDELLHHPLIYLVGCSLGDGHINRSGKRWTLVDGSSDVNKLKFSGEFVLKLASLLKNYLDTYEIRKVENKYDLRINNKLFCRFLNFFFGLPYGPKKNTILQAPRILRMSGQDIEKYFWRGCFDTDGNAGTIVSFCSSDKNMFRECERYLQNKSITPTFSERNVIIPISDTKHFSPVGFAHPRKQMEFLAILRKGATFKTTRIREAQKLKINQELLKIYDVLSIDKSGYRIRINSVALRKKAMSVKKVQKKIRKLFGHSFRRASNGLYYFKSKNVYEYLQSLFIYEPAWRPITNEEGAKLLRSWNDVWET